MHRKIFIATLLGFCLAASGVHAQDLVIKVGHSGPLTGNQAAAGLDNERGVRLALDDLNSSDFRIGGKRARFELVSEDDQGDPKTGVLVAQKLVDMGLRVVIGHYNSGVSIPASRIYNQAGIPMITAASTNPQLTKQGFSNVFRLTANDNVMGAAMAEFAAAHGIKRVAVIDDRTAYGSGVAEVFVQTATKLGLNVVKREFTNDKAVDFSAILTTIRGLKPDAIFFGGYYAQAATLARQMKQLNVPGLLLGGDGLCSNEVIPLGASQLEGRYFCAQGGEPLDSLPGGPAFRERFKKTFKVDIDAYAPGFYAATMAAARAMQAAGTDDPARVVASLKTLNFDSILGPVRFDATGEWVKAPVTLYKLAGNKLVPLPRMP